MNPVIEQAMTNMIRRIEILESQMRLNKTPNNFNKNPQVKGEYNKASKSQISYLRSLGGKTWDGMSKQEAGKGIDNVLFETTIQKAIKEPAEVDTDNAGLDGELL